VHREVETGPLVPREGATTASPPAGDSLAMPTGVGRHDQDDAASGVVIPRTDQESWPGSVEEGQIGRSGRYLSRITP
jgi:hypothetical protein